MFTQSVNSFFTISLGILKNFAYAPKKSKKGQVKFLRIAQLLFLAGIFFLSISLVYRIHQANRLSFIESETPKERILTDTALPTFINIPTVDIALRVDETKIVNGIWEVSEIGASHLNTSANPGETNPIIIYGHNTNDRFWNITKLKKEDKIILTAQNGHLHEYTVLETMVVNPNQVEILKSENKEALILYTCYGFADLKRFVVKAIPSEI